VSTKTVANILDCNLCQLGLNSQLCCYASSCLCLFNTIYSGNWLRCVNMWYTINYRYFM